MGEVELSMAEGGEGNVDRLTRDPLYFICPATQLAHQSIIM